MITGSLAAWLHRVSDHTACTMKTNAHRSVYHKHRPFGLMLLHLRTNTVNGWWRVNTQCFAIATCPKWQQSTCVGMTSCSIPDTTWHGTTMYRGVHKFLCLVQMYKRSIPYLMLKHTHVHCVHVHYDIILWGTLCQRGSERSVWLCSYSWHYQLW